jgi:hypothetical protein
MAGRYVIKHTTVDAWLSTTEDRNCPAEWAFEHEHGNDPERVAKAIREGRAWRPTLDAYVAASSDPIWDDVPQTRQARRQRVWDDLSGDTADVGRALVSIAPWEQYRRTASKRSITIGISLWLSVGNGAEMFRDNIVGAVKLCDVLMGAGYDVRVVGVECARPADGQTFSVPCDYYGSTFPIKEFGQPLDQEALLALGTPGFLRHFIFGGYAQRTVYPEMLTTGYCGKGLVAPKEFIAELGVDMLVARQWTPEMSQQDWVRHLYNEMEGVANAPA